MKLPITITQIAHQPKILPLNKIIKSSDFTIKQLSQNAFISKEDENIRPTEVGTIVDYLSRYVLLADEHAFDVANAKAKQDLIHGIIPVKEYKKLLDQEERLRLKIYQMWIRYQMRLFTWQPIFVHGKMHFAVVDMLNLKYILISQQLNTLK